MKDTEKREKLLYFLDHNAFDPILSHSEEEYSGEYRELYRDIRKSTESEKRRFHQNYTTPAEIKQNYLSDLSSRTAKKKNAELGKLHLPQLPQFRNSFERLCNDLGI